MILLDTNVVSEAIKPEPHPSVRAWLDAQVAETLFLPSITIAELLFGIGVLPEGRRKTLLAARIDGLLDAFAGRILPFDRAAASAYAAISRARARDASVATCNTGDYEGCGIEVIDPWLPTGSR